MMGPAMPVRQSFVIEGYLYAIDATGQAWLWKQYGWQMVYLPP